MPSNWDRLPAREGGALLRFAVEWFFTPAKIKDLLKLTERLAA